MSITTKNESNQKGTKKNKWQSRVFIPRYNIQTINICFVKEMIVIMLLINGKGG